MTFRDGAIQRPGLVHSELWNGDGLWPGALGLDHVDNHGQILAFQGLLFRLRISVFSHCAGFLALFLVEHSVNNLKCAG